MPPAGPVAGDVAHTWLVLACSLPVTGGVRQSVSLAGRRLFLDAVPAPVHARGARAYLAAAATYRLANRTLPPSELESIARLVEEVAGA